MVFCFGFSLTRHICMSPNSTLCAIWWTMYLFFFHFCFFQFLNWIIFHQGRWPHKMQISTWWRLWYQTAVSFGEAIHNSVYSCIFFFFSNEMSMYAIKLLMYINDICVHSAFDIQWMWFKQDCSMQKVCTIFFSVSDARGLNNKKIWLVCQWRFLVDKFLFFFFSKFIHVVDTKKRHLAKY